MTGTPDQYWDAHIGPFYDARGVQDVTRLTEPALDATVAAGDILSVSTTDGTELFPVFQFSERGELLPALAQVIRLLTPVTDDLWDIALWLNTRSRDFEGNTAAQILRSGKITRVLHIATRDSHVLDH